MGRPLAKIDWDIVNDLLIAGCPGTEIAASLGWAPETIYLHCQQEHGISFTEYSRQYYGKGENILRRQQFLKAIGQSEVGDNTLLIWLGKTRLKQSEKQEISITTSGTVPTWINEVDGKSKDLVNDEST